MKKKIVSLLLVVALLATAVISGTLAYFNDTDAQVNTFTTGNVKIDLFEDFGDNSGIEKLLPATGSAQDGTLLNGIEKEVYVENIGTELTYVRVHIAIPTVLDNGKPDFDAGKNVLHFNADDETMVAGKWNWGTKITEGRENGTFYAEGDTFNYYTTKIDGESYNVYVVTYETALAAKAITEDAIHQVYLDSKVTNADIEKIIEELGEQWYIYVVAEGAQVEGFTDAYDALNTQFGDPAAADYNAPDFKADSENKKFVEMP